MHMRKWKKPKLTVLVKGNNQDNSLNVEVTCKVYGQGGSEFWESTCKTEMCGPRCSALRSS